MKKAIRLITAVVALAASMSLAACSVWNDLDVIGKQSVVSFGELLKAAPDLVTADESGFGWSLSAPDGSARFIWSASDAVLEMDAEPFIRAGLDLGRLPDGYSFSEAVGDKETAALSVGVKLGDDPSRGGEPSPLWTFERIAHGHRDLIGYHMELDHFNIDLGGGNLFEWAKDMMINGAAGENQDKDIVFVLNPDPLIAAGVDPEKIDGWAYAKVSAHMDGKPMETWKLLKPINLK